MFGGYIEAVANMSHVTTYRCSEKVMVGQGDRVHGAERT
jgi:hypothetical protein